MSTEPINDVLNIGERLSDKYLTFKLGQEEYALQILAVQRIIQMQDITPVPKTPEFVRGVINLRGKIIPIIDIRKKFDMGTIDDTDTTCIVVVQIETDGIELTMGIVIDAVSEVLFINVDQIQETPSFGTGIETEFIMGIAKVKDQVIMLLDINKILSQNEMSSLSSLK